MGWEESAGDADADTDAHGRGGQVTADGETDDASEADPGERGSSGGN